MRSVAEVAGKSYVLDTEEKYPGLPYFVQSNLMRLEMAVKVPDLFYIDSDVELFKIPDFPKVGPYMSTCDRFEGVYPALFYVNNETSVFKRVLENYKLVYNTRPLINLGFFTLVNTIDTTAYKHYYFTHRKEFICTD